MTWTLHKFPDHFVLKGSIDIEELRKILGVFECCRNEWILDAIAVELLNVSFVGRVQGDTTTKEVMFNYIMATTDKTFDEAEEWVDTKLRKYHE